MVTGGVLLELNLVKCFLSKAWQESDMYYLQAGGCGPEILDDYESSPDLGEEYWSKWDKREYKPRQGSMVDHEALERVATRLGYADMGKVKYISEFLEHGASLGIEGEGRLPSMGQNNHTCYEYGSQVADSLQAGIEDGYLCGPLTKEEVDRIWP